MGFALESDGATAPEWPHLRCGDAATGTGRGWAWHDDESRRSCFSGETVAAPADLVANAIDGRALAGVDRLLSIARLRERTPGGILRVFRNPCRACGGNHWERAQRAIRSVGLIHPDAIDLLRRAQVPESFLCEPRYLKKGDLRGEEPRKARRTLPVWKGDAVRTRAAQLIFASQYALENGIAMGVPEAGERTPPPIS